MEYREHTDLGSPYMPEPRPDMTVGDWIITLILTAIPGVNVICLIVWAVSSSPYKRSRKNWAIAQIVIFILLIAAVYLVLHYGSFSFYGVSSRPTMPGAGSSGPIV